MIGADTGCQADVGQVSCFRHADAQICRLDVETARETKSAVEKAKIQRESRQLDLTNAQKELYRTIETMWLDASSAQQQFVAADAKLKSSQSSYELVNEQFKLGMKNTVELLTEKNNLMSAQQERVQAKYMAILNRVLLEFYAGNQIEV